MKEKQVYVLTSYRDGLENQIGVFTDIEKLNEMRREMFIEEITKALKEIGSIATAESMLETAIQDEFCLKYNDGSLSFWYLYYPNGVCCRVNGYKYELNVDILPLLDQKKTKRPPQSVKRKGQTKKYPITDFSQTELLERLAKKSKMDCWFGIDEDGYIRDLEDNGKVLPTKKGIRQLLDGLTPEDCENIDKDDTYTLVQLTLSLI